MFTTLGWTNSVVTTVASHCCFEVSADVAERFHALLPDSRLVFLSSCGHAPMLEQPAPFNDAVAEWLVDTRDRRGAVLVGGVR